MMSEDEKRKIDNLRMIEDGHRSHEMIEDGPRSYDTIPSLDGPWL